MFQQKLKEIRQFLKNIVKIIILLVKQYPIRTSGLIIFNIFSGLLSIIILVAMKHLIDELVIAINTKDLHQVIAWLVINCLLVVLMNFINRFCEYIKGNQVDQLNKYVTEVVIDKINELDYYHFEQSEIYNKIEKVNVESTQRLSNILDTVVNLIKYITILVSSVAILMEFNYMVVILTFISVLPIFFVSIRYSLMNYTNLMKRIEKMRFVMYLKYIFTNNENLKEIKLNRTGKYLEKLILNTYEEYIVEDRKVRKKSLIGETTTDLFQNILTYIVKLVIIVRVVRSGLGIGSFNMYISLVDRFQMAIGNILNIIARLYIDNLYINNLFELIDYTNEVTEQEKIDFNGEFSKIVFENVFFKYPNGEDYVLKNINLEIEANKSYSFAGLNGSGKTTLIKLLTGLYVPTQGKILIDKVDITKFTRESLYKSFGIIFQDYIKYPFNVQENIGMGNINEISNDKVIENAAIMAGADSFIVKLPQGYKTKLQKEWTGGVDLSLGQWQKLAISRALVSNAAVLVLDEPTASLDARAEYEIFKSFKKLTTNKTCILIAHRFSTVKLVDKIYVIDKGTVIEQGSHEELMCVENGLYKKLYELQINLYL